MQDDRKNSARRRRRLNAMIHHGYADGYDVEKGEGEMDNGIYLDPSSAVHHGFRMPEVPIPDYGAPQSAASAAAPPAPLRALTSLCPPTDPGIFKNVDVSGGRRRGRE